ncbi:MAG: ATP-binding protein [Candidatus Thiodiazotropha sp. (ex Epidulcina cf. delphinae)]|nr:ATP-binding protein [Candidatus Thiodiazotropha sp. (ex Epidulcina cf. delphinae)]
MRASPGETSRLKPLPQQQTIFKILKTHSQQGGFFIIIGQPGVGKTVLKEHLEQPAKQKGTVMASFSQTLHTYWKILKQLAESLCYSGSRIYWSIYRCRPMRTLKAGSGAIGDSVS